MDSRCQEACARSLCFGHLACRSGALPRPPCLPGEGAEALLVGAMESVLVEDVPPKARLVPVLLGLPTTTTPTPTTTNTTATPGQARSDPGSALETTPPWPALPRPATPPLGGAHVAASPGARPCRRPSRPSRRGRTGPWSAPATPSLPPTPPSSPCGPPPAAWPVGVSHGGRHHPPTHRRRRRPPSQQKFSSGAGPGEGGLNLGCPATAAGIPARRPRLRGKGAQGATTPNVRTQARKKHVHVPGPKRAHAHRGAARAQGRHYAHLKVVARTSK